MVNEHRAPRTPRDVDRRRTIARKAERRFKAAQR